MYEMEEMVPLLKNYNTYTTPPALKLRSHAVTNILRKVFQINELQINFLARVTKLFNLDKMHHRLVCYQITLSPRGCQQSSFVSDSGYFYNHTSTPTHELTKLLTD